MSRKPLDPNVHPTEPRRMRAWHDLMLGQHQARKTWRLLARFWLCELRECPICRRPVMRWCRLDEIKLRIFTRALAAAGGNVTRAAKRLHVNPRTFYYYLPARRRPDTKTGPDTPQD